MTEICPYLEYSFQILGRKWNGLILHYLSLREDDTAHFSEIKRSITNITPKALSLKLSELMDYELIEKKVDAGPPVEISYTLTERGRTLVTALGPIQQWASQHVNINESTN